MYWPQVARCSNVLLLVVVVSLRMIATSVKSGLITSELNICRIHHSVNKMHSIPLFNYFIIHLYNYHIIFFKAKAEAKHDISSNHNDDILRAADGFVRENAHCNGMVKKNFNTN